MPEIKEMGGYLPLELKKGSLPWDHVGEDNVFPVNTGRTALWCTMCQMEIQKLYLPYYYCPDVIAMLRKMPIELAFYHIDQDLMPVNVPNEEGAAVLLVNYYGLLTEQISALAEKYDRVILDQAHAFFAEPVLRQNVMNIYSCRKFIGVSDGAYLIGRDLRKPDLPRDVSYPRMIHLLKCYETGTNGAYRESKDSEMSLHEHSRMSLLTERILQNADFAQIAEARNRNAIILHERLAAFQNLHVQIGNQAPYLYPLLLERDIHEELVSRHIYVPYLWAHLLKEEWNRTIEQTFTKNLVALPIDQRYEETDMRWLANAVATIIEEKA